MRITVSDSSHPFVEETWIGQSCADNSQLDCTGSDTTQTLFCSWVDGTPFQLCSCAYEATLLQLD